MQQKRGRTKSEEKRGQIISAAAGLFVEQGYDKVSMDSIARQAGVSKQTVYSHFGTKEQLFTAAIESKIEEYQLGDAAGPDDTDPASYLREFCVHLAQLLASEDAMGILRVCISDAGRSDVGSLFWAAGPCKIREKLRQFLRHQTSSGFFQIGDIDAACNQLIGMLHSESHRLALLALPRDTTDAAISQYAQSCAAMFLSHYCHNETGAAQARA